MADRGRRGGGNLHTPSSSIPSLGYSDNLGVLSCVESVICKAHIKIVKFFTNTCTLGQSIDTCIDTCMCTTCDLIAKMSVLKLKDLRVGRKIKRIDICG